VESLITNINMCESNPKRHILESSVSTHILPFDVSGSTLNFLKVNNSTGNCNKRDYPEQKKPLALEKDEASARGQMWF
jgi:hypothetical protein